MTAIIKKEFISAFKTSYGWLLIAVYALLSAVLFSLFVLWLNTSYIGNYFGLWIFFVDLIFVSILSMKMLGEEKKTKTDQLILTSPIGVSGYVTGKFIGSYIIYVLAFLVNFLFDLSFVYLCIVIVLCLFRILFPVCFVIY